MRSFWIKSLVVIGVLLCLIFVLENPQENIHAEPNTEPLKWAPPELVDPVTINLGTGPTTTTLDTNTDYIINLPATTKFGRTVFSGGRNVVLIGGEIAIPSNPGSADSDKRAIQVANNQGVFHIEGVWIRNIKDINPEADYEPYDGIVINSPNSVVQIQNVRVDNVHGLQAGFHGDIIQPWGGVEQLRVYNLTGSTGYQGLFLAREGSISYGGAYLENIDLTYNASYGTDGGYLLYIDKQQQCQGSNGIYGMVINNFYINPRIPRFGMEDPTDAAGRSIMPDSQTSFGCAPIKTPDFTTGPNWYWPDLEQISDGSGSNGVVTTGTPPVAGDHYVPTGTPGLGIPGIGYSSPGYQNESYTEVSAMPTVTDPLTPPAPEISYINEARNQNPQSGASPQLSLSATFEDPVTSGNTIIVAANNYNAMGQPGNIVDITDNFDNEYILAEARNGTTDVTNGTRWHASIWYAKNVIGGENLQVTVHGPQNSFYSFAAYEYEGLGKVNTLDETTDNFTSTSSTSASAGTINTTVPNTLLFANLTFPSGSTATTVNAVGGGFSLNHFYNGNIALAAISRIAADSNSYEAVLNWSAAQPTIGVYASFLPEPPPPASFTPELNVTSPTNNTTPELTFSTTDDLGIDRYEVKVDDGSFSEQTSPYTLPVLSEGDHTITVRAYNAGETYTDGFVSVKVDLTDPEIVITAPTKTSNNPITDTTVVITDEVGISEEDVSATGGTIDCTQTSPTQVDCTSVISVSGDFEVTALDLANNSSVETSEDYVIDENIDLTPPTTSSSGIDASWHNTNVNVTLTCDDGEGSGCANTYYTTDGSTPTTSSTSGTSFTISTEGIHTIKYFSVDEEDNQESVKTATNTVKIDKTLPTGGLVINNNEASTTSRFVNLTISANDALSGVYQMIISENSFLSGASWEAYSSSKGFTLSSAAGTKVIYIQFKDNAGNISSTYSDSINYIPSTSTGGSQSGGSQNGGSEEETPAEEDPVSAPTIYESVDLQIILSDSKGAPLIGAKVTIHSVVQTGFTDSSGSVTFEDIEPGPHRLVIEYQGKTVERQITVSGTSLSEVLELSINLTEDTPISGDIEDQTPSQLPLIIITAIGIIAIVVFLIFRKSRENTSNTL